MQLQAIFTELAAPQVQLISSNFSFYANKPHHNFSFSVQSSVGNDSIYKNSYGQELIMLGMNENTYLFPKISIFSSENLIQYRFISQQPNLTKEILSFFDLLGIFMDSNL